MSSRTAVRIPDVTLIRSTANAGLYKIDGEEIWFPWSQVLDGSVDTDGRSGDLLVPRWIAEEKDVEFEEED